MLQVGADKQYQTIGAAIAAAQPGDTIEVYPGSYREMVKVDKPLTLTGIGRPVIQGNWKPGAPDAGYRALLQISAPGVTVEGFHLRDAPGRGINISDHNTTIRNCHVRNCRLDGLVANGTTIRGLKRIVVEDSSFIGLSLGAMDGTSAVLGAGASFVFVWVIDGLVRNNIVGYGWKEGILIDKNTQNTLYEGNIVFDTKHTSVYFNHSQRNTFTNNVLLFTAPPEFESGRGTWPPAVTFADERWADRKGVYDHSYGNEFTGNVAVGWGTLLVARNNKTDMGFDTQLKDTVIANNTFVAGPVTRAGINIMGNLYGRPHENSDFTGNVIHFDNAMDGAVIGAMGAGDVQFTRNAWSARPPANMQGPGDVYGDLEMEHPAAALSPSDEWPFVAYSLDNYRPIGGGTADGYGALAPKVVIPPPDPTPDLGAIADRLDAVVLTLSELIQELRA